MMKISIKDALEMAARLHREGKLAEAESLYRQILSQAPEDPDALHLMGMLYQERGDNSAALEWIQRAIVADSGVAPFHCDLGVTLRDMGRLAEAVEAYRRAIALKPDYADAYNNLGNALRDQGLGEQAMEAYEQAIKLMPEMSEGHYNRGITLASQGRLDEAILAYRRAMEIGRECSAYHSNLIYTMLYHPGHGMREVREELNKWAEAFEKPFVGQWGGYGNDRNPERPLRVGYVSADFRTHACAHAILPLLRNHDRKMFKIALYAEVSSPDPLTGEFEKLADGWRSTVGMSDEAVARQIREDKIDILVDLKVHTIGHRLGVFARKPAPVQATWIGYPGSTGLSAVDYRLSDRFLDPMGCDESVYTEKTAPLPDSFWCYDPLNSGEVEPNPLPAKGRGSVTFGSMNDFCKIHDGVLELWGRVLRAVEGSRLMVLADVGPHRQKVLTKMAAMGVQEGRVKFQTRRPRARYLELYHRIDIALDPFPYCGATTTLDSLWMGVPVVSLAGDRAVGRAGVSILTTAGVGQWVARDEEEYVRIAADLAGDLEGLEKTRASLRGQLEKSALMDGAKFARGMEACYREMWRNWCLGRLAR